jgi:hypothetical protein
MSNIAALKLFVDNESFPLFDLRCLGAKPGFAYVKTKSYFDTWQLLIAVSIQN